MKKIMKVVSFILAFVTVTACAFTGCGGGGSTKSVLKVWNYDGGVGSAWLYAAKERFEKANEDNESYVEGKKGVEIKITPTRDTNDLNSIKTAGYSVYFTQGWKYNAQQENDGLMLQIDDIVSNSTIEVENVTIESKLSKATQDALKAYDGHYYVLPHYQSFDGVVYNHTMFEQYGFFFAKNQADYGTTDIEDVGYGFIDYEKKNEKALRTVGPDGLPNTDDDGLPSSIEEFERLLKYMVARLPKSVAPFIWMDGSNKSYQLKFTNAIWANLEGYEGTMANFTFNTSGKKTRIITDWDGDTPIVEEIEISEAKNNVNLIYQQESRYYAIKLSNMVFSKPTTESPNQYYSTLSEDGSKYSNEYIQEQFLKGKAVMMLEGSYWENEAKTANKYPDSAKDLDIRMMPLPVQATGSVTEGKGRQPVQIDTLESYAFINGNVRTKHGEAIERLAKDFLKFLYTDESLAEFTTTSSVVKNVNYDLSTEQKNSLSSFALSTWNMKKNGKIVVPISDHAKFVKNPSEFTLFSDIKLWNVKVGGINYETPYSGARAKISAKDYFDAMKKDADWFTNLRG